MHRTFALLSAALFTVISLTIVTPGQHARAAAAQVSSLLTLTYPGPDGTRLPASPHKALARTVRVRAGDTLTSVAARVYGSPRDWQALWWVNRRSVPDPDLIRAGQVLRLSGWHPDAPAWLAARAQAAIPAPEPVAAPSPVSSGSAVAVVSPVSTSGVSAFEACVIARESGGNPAAYNPASGASGLFGFLPSTWASLGLGYPGGAYTAPASVQYQGFAIEFTRDGASPWSAYDGC